MHSVHRSFSLAAIALGALAAVACRESHPHDDADEHHHAEELASVQLTVWQGRFELFLEHRVLVAGEPSRFAAHVSDLEKNEARARGPVTFRFTQAGGPPVVLTSESPARAGIYTPEVTLPREGVWQATLTVPADGQGGVTDHVLALPDFTVFASEHDALHAELPEPPEGIAFLKEQQWKLRTRAEPVARRRLVEEIRVPGTIAAQPSARAHVTPPLAGRLVAAPDRKWPELGARVKQGEVLAWVEPPLSELVVAVARADAESAQALVAVEQADAAARRVRTLAEQKARTARELEESEFALRTAQARLDAALAVQEAYRRSGLVPKGSDGSGGGAALPRLALIAPIEGVVTRLGAVPGEHVAADEAVFELLDARVLHVEARVPEIDLPRLGQGGEGSAAIEAALTTPGTDAPPAPITGSGGGRLAWRDAEIDATTRTLTLHFELPDAERRFAIGQSLVVHLTTSVATDALALPESAIVDEDARAVAFVQLAGEAFEKRELVLGIRDRGFVEVKSGLVEGDRVMVEGAYAVRLASLSTTLPAHGHAH